MRSSIFFFFILILVSLSGCEKDSPTETKSLPLDANPTKILQFSVNNVQFNDTVAYVVAKIGDTIHTTIVATDKDGMLGYDRQCSNIRGYFVFGNAQPYPDTMEVKSSHFIDSVDNPMVYIKPFRPGEIFMEYFTIRDSLNFGTRLTIQYIIGK